MLRYENAIFHIDIIVIIYVIEKLIKLYITSHIFVFFKFKLKKILIENDQKCAFTISENPMFH